MPHVRGLVPFVVCGFLLACQGDQNLPSDPGRDLGPTASGVCKSEDFTARTGAMYTSSSLERTRLQQCKTAMAAEDKGNLVKAEAAVNAILVAIYEDYLNEGTLQAFGSLSLEQSAIDYMASACRLAALEPGSSECLIPDETTDFTDGSWVVAGPLATGNKGALPDLTFGFRVDGGTGVYVFVSSRPVEIDFLGDCPGSSDNDCQSNVFDVDADGSFPGGITVESCEEAEFVTGRLRHMHCPDGECVFGFESPAPNLIVCEEFDSTGLMRFLNVATKPVQWVIHATPAYAAGFGTKFTSFSPIVIGDMDPRARGLLCTFTSQYNNGSEGSICELFKDTAATIPAQCAPFNELGDGEPCSCASVADENNSLGSSCQMNPKVPESVVYTVVARKNEGGGIYNTSSTVTLAPNEPARGGTAEVCFSLAPQTIGPVACN